ncbi:MAG: Rieske (2Fe-2S) protein [Gemmatimonadota bacterium]
MSSSSDPQETPARRGFLASVLAVAAGGVAGLAAVIPGAAVLLDPLKRSRTDPDLLFVTKLAAVPEDGLPKKFAVKADRVDAWNTYPNTPVGAVYLRRTDSGEVAALNVVCPHAGCFVGIAPDRTRFACPCHKSSFAFDGTINDPASPSPRAMDSLDVEVRNGDEVWVRFRSFRPGTKEKVAVV